MIKGWHQVNLLESNPEATSFVICLRAILKQPVLMSTHVKPKSMNLLSNSAVSNGWPPELNIFISGDVVFTYLQWILKSHEWLQAGKPART